jgi:hypothetical protein
MLSKRLFLLSVVGGIGDAFLLLPPSVVPTTQSNAVVLLNAYSSRPFTNTEKDVGTINELRKIMSMSVQAMENELRDTYGQVFCNNHYTATHKEDLAEFLLHIRRTKKPVTYDEMPIIGDGTPGSWIDDKSGSFFLIR